MAASLLASILDAMLASQLGPIEGEAGNRFVLDGLTLEAAADGTRRIGVRRIEASSVRVASGAFNALEVGRLALHDIAAHVRTDSGRPRVHALEAASAELAGVKLQGPLSVPAPLAGEVRASHAPASTAASWTLGPLAAVDGTLRAEIVDAHLLFDADVTVPIRQGRVDFNQATVEHVGPDSRMGVSRLGLYVDAPNGRSYLYQFASAPVAGVEYERRSALPGPWGAERGRLQLQPFLEGLLRQGLGGPGLGLTEQARLLFERTAVSGDVQLGDGRFALPGVQGEMAGRAQGRNLVRLQSQAVGRGLTAEMPALSVRNAVFGAHDMELACDEITATLMLRLLREGSQLRFVFDLANLKLAGLRLRHTQQAQPSAPAA